MSYRDYRYYTPSHPREVKNGIRSKNRRGSFGTSWWAKRWIAVLESMDIGARLGRGRSYARRGQVADIRIGVGEVTAEVQGSRSSPYSVTIRLKPFTQKDRKALVTTFGKEALFAAKLLSGEMPEGLEEVFAGAGTPLFPKKSQDLKTECSCPDWSNPCKHVAAVYYLLAEEFDRDPFLLLKLRGLEREELPKLLGTPAKRKGKGRQAVRSAAPAPPAPPPGVPLPASPAAFWGTAASAPFQELPVSRAAEVPEAILKRLGGFPFWRGECPIEDALAETYRAAARRGLSLLVGEPPFGPSADPPRNSIDSKPRWTTITKKSPSSSEPSNNSRLRPKRKSAPSDSE